MANDIQSQQPADVVRSEARAPVRMERSPASPLSTKVNSYPFTLEAGEQQQIISLDHRRKYLYIRNAGISRAIISFSEENAAMGFGHTLLPGEIVRYESGRVPNNDMSAYSPNGTTLQIVEGVFWDGQSNGF